MSKKYSTEQLMDAVFTFGQYNLVSWALNSFGVPLAFREVYNTTWLIERHGFISPAALRQKQLQPVARAA